MIRVVFCTDGIFPLAIGGMQRHSRLLIEELARDPEMEIVVLHPHKEKLFSAFNNVKEVSLEPIDKSRNYLLECYRYSKRVYSELRKLPGYIVYSQGLSVWYRISDFSDRLIINPHGLEPYQGLTFKDRLIGVPFRMIFNYLFGKARAVISLGGKLTGILKGTNAGDKIAVIPNAVNVPEVPHVKGNAVGKITFLFVARFAANKGIGILLNVISQLNKEGLDPSVEFKLGGTGPLLEYFKAHHKHPNVHYLGFIDDDTLVELYKGADAFVFPTLFEGMPTVVLEAMCYSLPVIVSDVGATAELVDQSNGYLIKAGSETMLKEAILKFIAQGHEQRAEMGRRSFQKVKEKFTWQVVAAKHKDLFTAIHSPSA